MSKTLWTRAALVAAVIAAVTVQAPSSVSAQEGPPGGPAAGDGSSSATAGASCWGIKQQLPSSPDGVYWLNNASMGAPDQFHCDMTTDGGGWVLVGRGREGWSFSTDGQRSPATVRSTVDGPGAFVPAALSSETIDGLMAGRPIEALTDGIRMRRATTIDGAVRQEIRMKPRTFGSWSWAIDRGVVLDDISIDGVSYGESNSMDTRSGFAGVGSGLSGVNDERRVWSTLRSNKNWQGGFSLGDRYQNTTTRIRGDQAPDSYLWEASTERFPFGFTQIFIRPTIANGDAGFTPLPDAGLPAEANPFSLKDTSETAPWGVVGLDRTNEAQAEPWFTSALSLKVVGDRVFVGGRFSGVQNGPAAAPIGQRFLAAFDEASGEWIDTFRPDINGRVWNIETMPDGRLLIAGDFTEVNGNTDASGLAVLDPITGAVDTSWKAKVERIDSSGNRPVVRALVVAPDGIYAAGNFNRVTGGTWGRISVTRAVKLNLTNGSPIQAWKPNPNGLVVDMAVTPANDRIYLAGYFSALSGDAEKGYFAGVNTSTGQPIPGQLPFQPSVGSNKKYQQAVLVDGDHVYVGGSEHNIQKYRMSDNALVRAHVTRQGGDTQAMIRFENEIYVGCHCFNVVYSDTNNWSNASGFSRLDPMKAAGAFSADDFTYRASWVPGNLKGTKDEGPWAFDTTPDKCLYMAGDFVRGAYSGNAARDWLGGFAKFCPDDSTPPTAPSGVSVDLDGTEATIAFTPGSDESGSVQHWVYKNDRVVGTTWGNQFVDPVAGEQVARYTVRAVDGAGNKSATAPIVTVIPPAPELGPLVEPGSTWRYRDDGVEPELGWASNGFDDSAWASGTASFGWNEPVTTQLSAGRPVASYFRQTFEADPATMAGARVLIQRDDGAAVYVNGIEVSRSNLPAGELTSSTTASDYTWGADETRWFEYFVPAELLVDGTNTIAVQVHQASANNGDARFDLQLVATGAVGLETPPSAPVLSAVGGSGTTQLNWTESTDETLAGYLIERDGQPVAISAGLSWTDSNLAFNASHTYVVKAFDGDGNLAPSNAVTVAIAGDPQLVAPGSTWRYRDDGAAPEFGWASNGFDDSAWASGNASFGWNEPVTTQLSAGRPVASYFRQTFEADPATMAGARVLIQRDDGAAVYVNGIEVSRSNLPAGELTSSTTASGYTWGADETRWFEYFVPAEVLVNGTNTIAVQVHQASANNGDARFDLELIAT